MPKVRRTPEEIRERRRQYSAEYRKKYPEKIKAYKRKVWEEFKVNRPLKVVLMHQAARQRWKECHPDRLKASRERDRARFKEKHPEIGTRQNPNRTEKWFNKPKPKHGFQKGNTINSGRPNPNKGKKRDPAIVKKVSISLTGKKRGPTPEETRKKMSATHQKRLSGLQRKAPLNRLIRNSLEMKLWREAVFRRDDWTCVICKERGGVLHADHIKPFAHFPDLRFDINNGRTLCASCHRKTDTYGEGAKRLAKQLNLIRADTSRPNRALEAAS